MIIRQAQSKDAAALTALVLASKRSNGYDDAFMAACVDELSVTEASIADHTYWLAEDAGLPLGVVGLGVAGQIGEVHAFFIHPDHKRKGIGRKLWQVVLDAAQCQNLSCLKLDADPEAVPFYLALGFEVVGERPSGSIPGRMLPHMECRII